MGCGSWTGCVVGWVGGGWLGCACWVWWGTLHLNSSIIKTSVMDARIKEPVPTLAPTHAASLALSGEFGSVEDD